MKTIITHADDFGASPGTNRAIIDALRMGFIRNAGIMAVGPHLDSYRDELIELADEYCLGLHAVINSEWATYRWGPVLLPSEVPSLVQSDGTFYPTTAETAAHAKPDEIMAELAAQLQRLRACDLPPAYLDTHMRFICSMEIEDRLIDFCAREGLVYAARAGVQRFCPAGGNVQESAVLNEQINALPDAVYSWCWHPALRDAISERFWTAGTGPSDRVACDRAGEARLLCDENWVRTVQQTARTVQHDHAWHATAEALP